MKEIQLLASKPKILAQMRIGSRMVLNIRKIVQVRVFRSKPEALLEGLMQLISLSTINPKMMLVITEVKIIPYWIPCSIQTEVIALPHAFCTDVSVKEVIKLALQQHPRIVELERVESVEDVGIVTPVQLFECELTYKEHRPMMVELTAKNIMMIIVEKNILQILEQRFIQKLSQLMSSGEGIFSFLMKSFSLRNKYFCQGSSTQQQHKFLAQSCVHELNRQ